MRQDPRQLHLEPAVIEPPKLLKNETLLDALDRVRRRGREVKASLHTVRSPPWPSAHVKRRVREIVERSGFAARCEPSTGTRHRLSWPSMSPERRCLAARRGRWRSMRRRRPWADRLADADQLTKKLHALVDEDADDERLCRGAEAEGRGRALGDILAKTASRARLFGSRCRRASMSSIEPIARLRLSLACTSRRTLQRLPPTTSPLVWDVIAGAAMIRVRACRGLPSRPARRREGRPTPSRHLSRTAMAGRPA